MEMILPVFVGKDGIHPITSTHHRVLPELTKGAFHRGRQWLLRRLGSWPLHIGGHCDRLVIPSHPRPYRPYQANNWRIGRLLSSDLFSQGEDGNPAENSFFLGQVSAPPGAASRSSTGGIVGSWCRGSPRIFDVIYLSIHLFICWQFCIHLHLCNEMFLV